MAGLYVHIPFCRQKCHYCNFYSVASGKFRDETIDAIVNELEIRKDYLGGERLNTVYFGGGTPSLFAHGKIQEIILKADKLFGIVPGAEITLEANPEDIGSTWLDALKSTSVNRLSIGVQSFNNADLRYLGRIHTAEKAESAVRLALEKGFENLSVDLIFGIPASDDKIWESNILKVLQYNIRHLSAYALTVEPGTALRLFIRKGKYQPVDEDQAAGQFEMLMSRMKQAGYDHYEISNFCLPGHCSKHNTSYWTGDKYLGVGPAAHSYDGNSRQWNVANLKKYIEAVEKNKPLSEKETLTGTQKYNEYVMTALRTMWGIDLEKVKNEFGEDFYLHLIKEAKPFENNQHLLKKNQRILLLTDRGKLFADKISSALFWND